MSTECSGVEELLQAHLDGELSAEELTSVEAHLAACAPCTDVRAELTVVAEQLGAMFAAREQAAVAVNVPGVPAAGKGADGLAGTPSTGKRTLGLGGPEQAHASGYRIEQEIARGGMGTVYRAVQLSLGRPVALKVLAPALAQDEEFVARFLREARVAATLSHPNLVQIYDVAREGDTLYYSMELVDGDDAEALLKRDGAFAPRRAVEVAQGVARALEAARQAGIVHRDVKPANVMITREGAVKLTDLGLAKDVETTKDGLVTQERKIIGSPNYMSPEQASDIRAATHRSDVYSLAATLLHLLTNEVPFAGPDRGGSPVEVISRVLRDPPSIPDLLPGGARLDPALRRVLVRALEKDPAARPATAGELALELARWLEMGAATELLSPPTVAAPAREAPRSARLRKPDSASHRVGRSSDATAPRPSARTAKADTGKHRRSRSNPFAFATALIAAALLLGVGLALLGGRRETTEPQVAPRTTTPPRPSTPPTPTPRPQRVGEVTPVTPVRPPVITDDPEAEKALAALEEWRAAGQRTDGDVFRRARDLALRYRDTRSGKRAEALRDETGARIAEDWDQLSARAHELEGRERWFDAAQLYRQHLRAVGAEDAPTALEAGLALRSVEAQIAVRLEGDLARVDELLARGEPVEAAAVANTIRGYAGPEGGAKAQQRLDHGPDRDGALAQRPPVGPAPAPDTTPAPPTPPAPEAVAMAEREKKARATLVRARELLDAGDVPGARAALERGKSSLEGVTSLQAEVEALVAALADRGPRAGLDDAALLACAFEGETSLRDDGRLQVVWEFEAPTEAADWGALPAARDLAARAQRFLHEQPATPPRGVTGEPWSVHKKMLVGWGYTRRRLGPAFRTDRPLTIEVDARGRQNVLIALHGGERTTIIGMGFLLEELPVSNIANLGGEAQKYAGRISKAVDQSRKRGPSAVIAREKFVMDLEEVAAQAHAPRDRNEFTIEVTPVDGGHSIAIKVGRRVVAQAVVEQPERVQVQLLTLGVPVAYDRLVVTGAPEGQVLERLKQLAKETHEDPEALRRRVREERERQASKDADAGKDDAHDRDERDGDKHDGDKR